MGILNSMEYWIYLYTSLFMIYMVLLTLCQGKMITVYYLGEFISPKSQYISVVKVSYEHDVM